MPEKHIGKVVQVTGPVLDIRFADGELPALLNAVELQNHGKTLAVEVAQHIGDNVARCIAMAACAVPKQWTPADQLRFRLVMSVWDGFSIFWANLWMNSLHRRIWNAGRFIARRPLLMSRNLLRKFWKPALKLST